MSAHAEILSHILKQGPLSIATYMETCLYHRDYGYYMTQNPFGKEGDFTTAPEITPLFGELLGCWVADTWDKLGSPSTFNLVECGPGRGTLMADMLHAIAKVAPNCQSACTPVLMEISPTLRQCQQQTLKQHHKATWAASLAQVDFTLPTILIGNEFFDAFPIRQFCGGHERTVMAENDTLIFSHPDEAVTYEDSPAQDAFLTDLKNKLTQGYALFIDYGYSEGSGDSLQAVKNHAHVSPLAHPGTADLTAHVNFARLRKIWGENNTQLSDQASFLMALGLPLRAAKVLENSTDDQKIKIEQAVHRLLHRHEMGSLFKVLALKTPNTPDPAGF